MRLQRRGTPTQAYIKYIKFLVAPSLLFTLLLFYFLPNHKSIDKTNHHLFNVSAFLDSSTAPILEPALIKKQCRTGGVEVLVGIPSAPGNLKARNAVRDSWAKHLPPKWTIFFVLGATRNTEIQNAIIEESTQYGDVYQATHFQDSYQNLTLKTLLMLQWSHQHCQKAQHILKIDDDVFLNAPKFGEYLECLTKAQKNLYGRYKVKTFIEDDKTVIEGIKKGKIDAKCAKWKPYEHIYSFIDSKTHKYESYAFGGYLYSNVPPDRDPNSKWSLSEELYSGATLPPFLSGTAYFLSSNLLPNLLYEARHTPILPLEDVYLTGVLGSSRLNLRLSHVDGWSRFRPWWDDACLYTNLMTAHGLNPKKLVDITNAVIQLTPEYCDTMYYTILSNLNDVFSYISPNVRS
ncbi:unnamed protein product [Meganyctiphanes norvegica]|uniref:Hexosyltransferase n=1 Tax=Meganyctiphanes norvegica TaxID=48144 RepID=A0AAV2PHA1_MEGNR